MGDFRIAAAGVALQCCEEVRLATTIEQARLAFRASVERLGFDTFACGEVDLEHPNRQVMYVVDWPQRWRDLYLSSGLMGRDPIVSELRHRTNPFTWSDLRAEEKTSRLGRDALDLFYQHGWKEGIAIPLPRTRARIGLISIFGPRGDIGGDERAPLAMMATAFYEKVRRLAPKLGVDIIVSNLTAREIDSLRLIARGHSDREMAKILGIKPATAHGYVEIARRKLNAKSRSEAAAIAVSLGLVDHAD